MFYVYLISQIDRDVRANINLNLTLMSSSETIDINLYKMYYVRRDRYSNVLNKLFAKKTIVQT